MTTDNRAIAEQNIEIAKFMGLKFRIVDHPNGDKNIAEVDTGNYWEQANYHSSWSELHRGWDKVYEEYCKITDHLKERRFYFDYITTMSNAMITGNITNAHRILYDAIMWVKNNKS